MAKDVNIKIKADGSQAVNEIEDVKSTLETLSDIGNVVSGVQSGLGLVKEAFDKVKDTIFELNELYNVQSDAETRLEVASRNNPYLDENSVNELKAYAGELQNIGEIGDESLLPLMANLAASGRTQTEIQNIMRAALEASATGLIDMGSAVQSLNNSLNGSVGSLGKLLPSLKNLTKEELENGKAIEEVRKAYDGMSESTANPLVQLSNAWGDLKEVLGGPINSILVPITQAFTQIVSVVTSATQGVKDFFINFKHFKDDVATGVVQTDYVDSSQVDGALKEYEKMQKAIASTKAQIDQLKEAAKEESDELKKQAEENAKAVEKYNNQLKNNPAYGQWQDAKARAEDYRKKIEELNSSLSTQQQRLRELQELNRFNYSSERANEIKTIKKSIEDQNKELQKTQNRLKNNTNAVKEYESWWNRVTKAQTENIAQIGASGGATAQLQAQEQLLKQYEEQEKATKQTYENIKKQYEEQEKQKQKQVSKGYVKTEDDLKVEKAIANYKETVKQKQREIEARKQLGETITEETEAQEMLNTMTSAYQVFWKTTGNLGRRAGVELRKEIEATAEKLKSSQEGLDDLQEDYFEKWQKAEDLINNFNQNAVESQIQLLQAQSDFLQDYLDKGEATERQAEKIKGAIKNIAYEIEKVKLGKITEGLEGVNSVYSNVYSTISELSSLATSKIETEAEIQNTKLEEQLNAGLISYEQYEAEKTEIEKEAKKEQYKYQMWEWSANLLQIGTNTALAMTKALTEGAVLGPILSASIGFLGAAQLTTAIANKPIPPSFASGGIVGGTSYYGDKIQANVNSGEMILNSLQQKELWNLANGNTTAQGLNVKINNYIGESADVSAHMNNGELEVIIQGVVSQGLTDGTFDGGLMAAQNRQMGISYSN